MLRVKICTMISGYNIVLTCVNVERFSKVEIKHAFYSIAIPCEIALRSALSSEVSPQELRLASQVLR